MDFFLTICITIIIILGAMLVIGCIVAVLSPDEENKVLTKAEQLKEIDNNQSNPQKVAELLVKYHLSLNDKEVKNLFTTPYLYRQAQNAYVTKAFTDYYTNPKRAQALAKQKQKEYDKEHTQTFIGIGF